MAAKGAKSGTKIGKKGSTKPKNGKAGAGKKLMHVVAMAAGAGAVNLELERFGAARKGIKAWVDGIPVVWLTTDRSALIPVSHGEHEGTVEVRGVPGRKWGIRVSLPPEASGGMNDTLPSEGEQPVIGSFVIDVP